MSTLRALSDAELVGRLPALVKAERSAMLDVIEHLVEMERRRLYLRFEVGSLHGYCIEHLGYASDAALKRHRVAKLALRFPQVLEELRSGAIHLSGLFLLSSHLTEENVAGLLGDARGKSKRKIEELVARCFPRPDVPASVAFVGSTCPGAGEMLPGRVEPLSSSRLRVEFTARAELREKLDRARNLLSHALPGGDLGELFERALDALIVQEERKRFGAGKPRKARRLKPGSRHVPVEVVRAVWERDGSRCTFVGADGHRCTERRFLTLEHRVPFALGGLPTLENLCLLCSAHNQERARQVFGHEQIEAKIAERPRTTSAGATEGLPPNAQAKIAERPRTTPAGATEGRPPNTQAKIGERPRTTSAVTTERRGPNNRALEANAQVLSSLCALGFGRSEAAAAVGHALDDDPELCAEQLLRRCLLLLVPKAS